MSFSRDIADLAKIQRGRMHLDAVPFDLVDALDQVRHPAGDQHLPTMGADRFVTRDLPALLAGDEHRFVQLLQRTTAAVLEHLPSEAFECRIGCAGEPTPVLSYEIHAAGTNELPEPLAIILEAAESGDPALPRQFGRSGLWLSLVDALARLMGGRVVRRAGTRLVGVEIPVTPVAAEGEACSLAFRVLVVDDGRVNQIVARRILEQIGCEVTVAEDGRAAFELYRRASFDLILMDWEMPGMNGDEASRRIREADARQVPIIGITASGTRRSWADCIQVGMNDLIPKPLRPDDLVRAVTYWRASAARLD
ncbi:MAG: response regulator [Gemmatimonadales bacterium]